MASPPFNPNETLPEDTGVAALFPGQERTFRDIVESWLLYEHDRTGHHALPVITTVARDGDSGWPVGAIIFNTTLQAIQMVKSIGPVVWSTSGFEAGTRMPFQQTAAPTGWTKVTDAAYEDAALVVTTGSVAATGTGTLFSTVMAARTISQANLPNYALPVTDPGHVHSVKFSLNSGNWIGGSNSTVTNISSVGGTTAAGAAISATTDITVASGGSGTAMDFAVKKVGLIIATKD